MHKAGWARGRRRLPGCRVCVGFGAQSWRIALFHVRSFYFLLQSFARLRPAVDRHHTPIWAEVVWNVLLKVGAFGVAGT